jgi:glycosyltransferase involved in cell wall biosynthesis
MKIGLNGRFLAARATGVQRFAREVSRRLADRVELTVFVPANVSHVDLPAAAVVRGRLPGIAWEQFELPHAAAQSGVDVVLHLANSCPRSGGPHVQVVHDLTPVTRPELFRWPYRAWARWAHIAPARRAAAVIAVSEHWAAEISRIVGIPADRVHVTHQGIAPLDAPASEQQVAAVREAFSLPERYFLAVGVDDPRKGFDFVAGAHAVWRAQRGNDEPVALLGVGGRYPSVHAETGARKDHIVLGHVTDEDLRGLYTGAVALLFPSIEEGFGRPPLEAMACGTRVLAAPYATAPEMLGDAADLVPLESTAWQAAFGDVSTESAASRAQRIERGRLHAARFSWAQTVDDVTRVCERVVSGLPARSEAHP